MKQEQLKRMYGTTPDSFARRVSFALKETEERPMKRITWRAALIAAAILAALMAAAYAAFSSQVTQYFGKLYGNDMQAWLEQGQVATPGQSHTMDGVVFTVDEVVYHNNGLYGMGSIRVAEGGDTTLLAEDFSPDDPYGYDVYGAGGRPEKAPDGAPSVADVARERGGKLLVARALPDQIGVDGGELLSPGSIGYSLVPQRDGSIRFHFELSDAYAVEAGSVYTIVMRASLCEMTLDGEWLEDTRQRGSWTVEIAPTPIQGEQAAAPDESAAPEATGASDRPVSLEGVEIIVPDEYRATGTLPVYRATARDFGANLQPELFNQSGVAARDDYNLDFADGAALGWAPEAIFYGEYTNAAATEDGTPDLSYPLQSALSGEIASLASAAMHGWPGTGVRYALEKTALTKITLDGAKATLEALLAELGLTGYECDYALDMSAERIRALGADMLARIESGEVYSNGFLCDYDLVTPDDEGYYLSYHKFGDSFNQGNDHGFSVYAYVTARGVVYAAIRDGYIQGDVYATPDKLIDPQTALAALPGEMAASRFPATLQQIVSVRLTYAPKRAENKADGMVLSPIWLTSYHDTESAESGYECWAEFDAVDGKLLNAVFK